MLDRYRHIIWDWNGTLLNDLALSVDVMNGVLARRGLPRLDCARYHAVFDFPVQRYYRLLGLDSSEEGFRVLSAEFIGDYDRRRLEAALHPGARALLAAIRHRGLTQSILSAYRHDTLREIVAHFRLTEYFAAVDGLDDIYAHSKVALGRRCIAQLGVPPSHVLLIGDTLHDLEVAAEIGTDCVLVAHGHHPLERLSERCPRVYRDLSELGQAMGLSLPEAHTASTTAQRAAAWPA